MNGKGTKWSWEILLSTAQTVLLQSFALLEKLAAYEWKLYYLTDLPTVDCSMFLKITILHKARLK